MKTELQDLTVEMDRITLGELLQEGKKTNCCVFFNFSLENNREIFFKKVSYSDRIAMYFL